MAVQDDPAITVSVQAEPSPAADVSDDPISPVYHKKPRVGVAKKKLKLDVAGSPRRSPRVLGSNVDSSSKQNPRILAQMKASPLGKGKSTTSKVKQVKKPASKINLDAAKGKKPEASAKASAKGSGKAKPKAKSVRFKDDADFVGDDSNDDTTKYKIVQRKRKRIDISAPDILKFNTSARVSLKEVHFFSWLA